MNYLNSSLSFRLYRIHRLENNLRGKLNIKKLKDNFKITSIYPDKIKYK